MGTSPYCRVDIGPYWETLNDHLVELIDCTSENNMDWRPSDYAWSFRQMFVHIAGARHHWLANAVRDGEALPDFATLSRTNEGLKSLIQGSWQRTARFLSHPAQLDARYAPPAGDPGYYDPERFDGHFIAYHRLVHDVHHRAEILQQMSLAGIEPPYGRRRRPL